MTPTHAIINSIILYIYIYISSFTYLCIVYSAWRLVHLFLLIATRLAFDLLRMVICILRTGYQ